jgi:hypothetical protein
MLCRRRRWASRSRFPPLMEGQLGQERLPVRSLGCMEVARRTDSRTTAVREGGLVAWPTDTRRPCNGDPLTQPPNSARDVGM